MNGILKNICLVCIFINIYLGFVNFANDASWAIIAMNFSFAALCWYSYENS